MTGGDITLGEKIRQARLDCDLTQKGLAAKVGADEKTVLRWERDHQIPGVEHRAALIASTNGHLGWDDFPSERAPSDLRRLADRVEVLEAHLSAMSEQLAAISAQLAELQARMP